MYMYIYIYVYHTHDMYIYISLFSVRNSEWMTVGSKKMPRNAILMLDALAHNTPRMCSTANFECPE